jgi:hypothetical protein
MDHETARRIERLEQQVALLNRHLGFTGNEEYQPPTTYLLPPSVPGEPQDMMVGMPGAFSEPRSQAAFGGPQDMMTGGQPRDPRLSPAFYDAIAADKKILAIKIYREATGVGLKEAKDYVDSLDPRHHKRR